MRIVLDASMAVAWLFTAERSEVSRTVLRRVVAEGAIVPSLWRLEVANVLHNAVRRGRCKKDYVDRSLGRLAQLSIVVDSETDKMAWTETRRLASAHGLTVYDAAYLELASRLQQPLATCDEPLANAARSLSLDVLYT